MLNCSILFHSQLAWGDIPVEDPVRDPSDPNELKELKEPKLLELLEVLPNPLVKDPRSPKLVCRLLMVLDGTGLSMGAAITAMAMARMMALLLNFIVAIRY